MMMDDDGGFTRWFVPWLGARPDLSSLGWYTPADLEAAFNGDMAAKDDRPGQPVSPPQKAGPVPEQD